MPVKKLVKFLYVLITVLVVFTGALMIVKGAREPQPSAAESAQITRTVPLDQEPDSAA